MRTILLEEAKAFVRPLYNQPHRFYHNWSHIEFLLDTYCSNVIDELILATLFHDSVYDIKNPDDNEQKSCELFLEFMADKDHNIDTKHVVSLIMAAPDNDNPRSLLDADMSILAQPIYKLLEYEHNIFKEYQFHNVVDYIKGRITVLTNIKKHYSPASVDYANCNFLIDYVKNRTYKIGIYAGSFNPYHLGHEDICLQAEQIFDKVILAQGINTVKDEPVSLTHSYRQVIGYGGLITDVVHEQMSDNIEVTLVRGIRDADDLSTEIRFSRTVHDLNKVKSVVFLSSAKHAHISSSLIRSLYSHGEDSYSRYLP